MIAYLLIGAYLIAVTLIGWRGNALASDPEMFNIFGRRAKTLRASAGYLSLIGGGELITITQLGYDNGWSVLWFLGGVSLGFLALAFSSRRIREIARERQINTLSGFYADQFGASAGWAATFIFIASLGSLLTIQFIVGSDLLSSLLGIPPWISILLIGGVILLYLIPAGLVAVLSTDVLRAIMMSLVLIAIVGSAVWVSHPVTASIAFQPLPYPDNVIYLILGFFGALAAADVWQTLFASQDYRVVRKSLIWGAFTFSGIGGLLALLGVITRSVVPSLAPGTTAFVTAATHVIPGGLAPVVAVLVVGSVMSTADTEIWVVSTLLLSNLRPSFAKGSDGLIATAEELKKATRWTMPMVAVLAMAAAYFSGDAQAIYTGLLSLLSASGVAILGALFFRPKGYAVSSSLWAGIVMFLVLAFFYRLNIPLLQSLLPFAASSAGCLIGYFVPRSPADPSIEKFL